MIRFFSASFERKDGSSITYRDYFRDRYKLDIKELKQPMLISMPKDKDRRRGDMEHVKIIPELTQMTGLTDEQRDNYKLTAVSSNFTVFTHA
jgi:aubergine-like protein